MTRNVAIVVMLSGLFIGMAADARAHDRFFFGVSIGGPPPVFLPAPWPYDPCFPPPIVLRREIVVPSPQIVYRVPVPRTVRIAQPAPRDSVLIKIGELHSADWRVRRAAAEWLGKAGDRRAVRPLCESLRNDRESTVRRRAAQALGALADSDAERALQGATTFDPSDDVRDAAEESLLRISRRLERDFPR